MELQNINRIAVFKMRNIGDVLVVTPLLRALRETFPQARISAVVNSGTEAMLAHNPHLDDVLVYRRDGKLGDELAFARDLRRHRFDLTIGLTEGDRTAWYSLLCGARYRVGILNSGWGRYDFRRLAYNHPVSPHSPQMHEVEKHFWQVAQAGLQLRNTTPGELCLVVPEDLRAWARQELAPLRPSKVVHIHPVSRWLSKCWDNASMAAVIDWLQTERDARVIVTTGPAEGERARTREILALCRTQPVVYDGNLSLTQSAAICAESDGYFGVDTAPMHVAAAVGVPVIALFGPSGPKSWSPWTPRGRVLSRPCLCAGRGPMGDCSWEPGRVRACLAAIPVSEAQATLDEMLALPKLERPLRT